MNIKLYISSLLIVFYLTGFSQVPDKIVVVESSFRPEVEQAEKLSLMPRFSDTTTIKQEINYTVLPSRLETSYKIKPIKPAKLVGSALDELYNSQIRLGLGNYTTPLAEFNIHNLRSKEYAIGAYVFHRSSHFNMELKNGSKVPAGYSRNRVSLYGKRFYNRVNAEAELYLNTDKYRFYGYNIDLVPDTTLEPRNVRQYYTQVGGRMEVYSTVPDSGAFQYRLGIDANHFGDDFKNHENHLHLPGQISFPIKSFRIDLNANYHLYAQKYNSTTSNKHVVQLRPQIKKRSDEWEILLGLNSYLINNTVESNYYVYPEARIGFKVIDRVMEAYFGVDGGVEINNFSKVTRKNPYMRPGLQLQDSRNKLTGYGGFKGQLASNAGYLLDVRFSTLENVHFYVNDTLTELENHFDVVYDKMERVQFNGELWYSPFTFLDLYVKGQYNTFNLTSEVHPWHIPATTTSFVARYNFKEKIYAGFDLINYGKRFAKNMHLTGEVIELEPIWDLNLSVEYKYSQVLSAFVELHNLLSKQYFVWNQYPSQKINVMVGFSYKF